jgi:hypothetical protein
MSRITEGPTGFPAAIGNIPFENGFSRCGTAPAGHNTFEVGEVAQGLS